MFGCFAAALDARATRLTLFVPPLPATTPDPLSYPERAAVEQGPVSVGFIASGHSDRATAHNMAGLAGTL